MVTFIVLLLITKIISVSSVMGAVQWVIYAYIYSAGEKVGIRIYTTVLAAVIGGLVIIKHADNIRRLRRGEEKMIKSKK